MSIENAILFVKELGEDEEYTASLKGKTKDEVLNEARTKGLDFSLDELEEVCEYAAKSGEEIDLEELEKVVGGLGPLVIPVIGAAASAGGFVFSLGKGEGWW